MQAARWEAFVACISGLPWAIPAQVGSRLFVQMSFKMMTWDAGPSKVSYLEKPKAHQT